MKRVLLNGLLSMVAGAALAGWSPMASASGLDGIMKAGVIKVAVPQDFPPFGSVGSDLKPQGYDIDMANLIGQELGVKVELTPVASGNRIPYLTTKKVDLVISSLGKNAEREQVIDFTLPYAPFFNGVFGPAEVAVSKAEDLAGKTVGVTRGAIEDLELTKIAPPSATLKRFEDNNGTISAFLSGQVDLIATGNVVAGAIIAKNPPKKPMVKFLIKNSPCFIGLNKNEPELLKRINDIISKATQDGRLAKLDVKWLGAARPEKL